MRAATAGGLIRERESWAVAAGTAGGKEGGSERRAAGGCCGARAGRTLTGGLLAACRSESAGRLLEVVHAEVARGEARLQLCPERRVALSAALAAAGEIGGEMRPPPAGRFFWPERAAGNHGRSHRQGSTRFGTQIGKAQFAQGENRAKRPLVVFPDASLLSLRLQRSAGFSC